MPGEEEEADTEERVDIFKDGQAFDVPLSQVEAALKAGYTLEK